MLRHQIDSILRGEPPTWLQPGGGRAVILVDEQMTSCSTAVKKLLAPSTRTARPLQLASSQLPPIF
jgi:hypothetical protein